MQKSITLAIAAILVVSLIAMPVLAVDAASNKKVPGATRFQHRVPSGQGSPTWIYSNSPYLEIETILVVDDDGGPNNGDTYLDIDSIYTAALDAAGYTTYDVFTVDWSDPGTLIGNGPDISEMLNYDCIIWFTGETWGFYGIDVLTATDETNLGLFLDQGGTLFLNAQDYLYASYPNAGSFSPGQFPYDYLGVSSVLQDFMTDSLFSVDGVAGSFAQGLSYSGMDPYGAATIWMDLLSPRDQGLLNITSPGTGICAVQYDGGTFYTAFSTCGVEGFVNGANTTAEYMDAVLTGLGAYVSVTSEPVVITGYLLDQNYPNPFNPSTEIRYQLPVQGNVTLTVYNVTGQEVAKLIDGEQSPGIYHVRWNALNQPSGMYFYKMAVNGYQDVRRMMLLK